MIRKRYIIFACIILLIVFGTIIAYTQPALPFIQLPGEFYPPTLGLPVIDGITNTFMAAVFAWIIVLAIGLGARARSRSADEVPTGFYNFLEFIIEAGMNFATNLGGTKKAKDFFPLFLTIILYVLMANWMGLIPGIDSIGFSEYLPHAEAQKVALAEGLEYDTENFEHRVHEVEEEILQLPAQENFKDGPILLRGDSNEGNCLFNTDDPRAGCEEGNNRWTIVPYLRAAATDLNFTLALSFVTMFMVQFYGFKYLGGGYLKKFFNFDFNAMSKSPIKIIDPAVGLLELVGEISRIISFAFRLLGNIFAGQILLFVIAFLIPVANIVFFGLEFFVGLIQAMVFGLLALIFMVGSTESHHDDEEGH